MLQSEQSSFAAPNLSIASRDRWLFEHHQSSRSKRGDCNRTCRKTLTLTALVLQNSPVEIVGHSNVKSPRAAADDVDAVVVFFHKIHWRPRIVILSEVGVRQRTTTQPMGPRLRP